MALGRCSTIIMGKTLAVVVVARRLGSKSPSNSKGPSGLKSVRGRFGVVFDIDDSRFDEKGDVDAGDATSGVDVADGSWFRVIPGVCCRLNFGVAKFGADFGVYVCAGKSAKDTSLVLVFVFAVVIVFVFGS